MESTARHNQRVIGLGMQILRGSVLSYGSFLTAKLFAFLSTLVLVRLLVPRDFGLVGYSLVVLGLLDVVKNLGITSALIYRQDIPDDDAGEAFVLAVAMGIALFGVCWVIAPAAANFFHDQRVVPVTRVLGLTLVFDALGGVHAALLQKRLRFGRLVIPDVVLSVTKGSVAVLTALLGAGYWSLVWGQLAGVALWTVANWWLCPWWPRLQLRWASARRLLGYGLHILLAGFVGAVILTADNLIVGRVLGARALGLYAVAFTIPQLLMIGLAMAVSNAVFPAFAMLQRDRNTLERQFLRVQHYGALVQVPIGLGICVVTPGLVHALFGPEWWAMVPVMQLLAIFALLQALVWSAGDAFKAVGRPDILWKLGLAQIPVLITTVLIAAHLDGIVGVAIARVVVAAPFTFITWWCVRSALGIRLVAIRQALRIPLLAGAVMFLLTELLALTLTPLLPAAGVLVVQIVVGVAAYCGVVFANEPELRAMVRSWLRRRTPVGPAVPSGPESTLLASARVNDRR
jgi:PST family polysaccharide transporter